MATARTLDDLFSGLAHYWPGYQPRAEQVAMAEAVARTAARGGTLLAEAGTGVGKSLAYLLPALLLAQEQGRVLIATSHKPLQDQLANKELPLIHDFARSLGLRPPRWATLKGIANYLCLAAQDEEAVASQLVGFDPALSRFLRWQEEDAGLHWNGDWEELPLVIPSDLRARLSTSSDECLGNRCPHYAPCYALNTRRAAATADIVITNHALLAIDIRSGGRLLPGPFDLIIIDEGHLWEESLTRALGAEIGSRALNRLLAAEQLRGLDSELRDRAAAAYSQLDMELGRLLRAANEGKVLLTDPLLAGRKLAGLLLKLADLVRPRSLKRAAWMSVVDVAALPDAALGDVLADRWGTDDSEDDDLAVIDQLSDAEAAAARTAARLESAAARLGLICALERKDHVYYAEQPPGGNDYALHAAPISVADKVSDWWDEQTVVITSATLSDGESFDFFSQRLGIYRPQRVQLASPFDYAKRTRLLLWPVEAQAEASAAYFDQLAERIALLASQAQGRLLALFTSYRAMDAVHLRLLQGPQLAGTPLLRQGDAPQLQLTQQFQGMARATLLGTRSWWQGVDLPGLRVVTMDKLPFPQIGDPLVAARMSALEAEGYSSFGSYTLPSALITFRQGLGRLMRREQDRGLVVCFDSRIQAKSYGPRFQAALPPAMPLTNDPAAAIEWLKRG